jgi:hypothetical protein
MCQPLGQTNETFSYKIMSSPQRDKALCTRQIPVKFQKSKYTLFALKLAILFTNAVILEYINTCFFFISLS